jgi:hypothetical protein
VAISVPKQWLERLWTCIAAHYFNLEDPNWTVAYFQEHKFWSALPTLVIHPYGQERLKSTRYFECAVKALLDGLDDKDQDKDKDGYIDFIYTTNNDTEAPIDICAGQVF